VPTNEVPTGGNEFPLYGLPPSILSPYPQRTTSLLLSFQSFFSLRSAQHAQQKTDPRYTNGHHPYDGAYDSAGRPRRHKVRARKIERRRRVVRIVEPEQARRGHKRHMSYRYSRRDY
jgi:hypothetical protein